MSFRSGIGGQLGVGQETTWGTRVAPDHWYEPDSEALKNNIARIEGKGLRLNNRMLRTDRWAPGKKGVSGTIDFEVLTKSFGLWFKHMLGVSDGGVASGSGKKFTYTVGDPYGLGLSVQVGRPGTSAAVSIFDYIGCKVESWTLSNTTEDNLMLQVSLDGKDEILNGNALATPSYPSNARLFSFFEGNLSFSGAPAADIGQWSLQNNNGIKTDRYYIQGTGGTKKEQIVNALMAPTGSMEADFADTTLYGYYLNGTLADMTLTYTSATTYDTGLPFKIVVIFRNCRFDGETPSLQGPEIGRAHV